MPPMSKIEDIRKAQGLAQEDVARAAGLRLRTYQRVEALGRGNSETVRAIAKALGVPMDDLFEEAS